MDSEQINLFDWIVDKCRRKATPKLDIGQPIFILSLDVVQEGTVNNSWVCGDKEPYFGYSIDFKKGLHTVVWDYDIGITVFSRKAAADAAADKVSSFLVKIKPSDIVADDVRCFSYYRKSDNYRLDAIIAKVGETQLYEKGFMCYHFLRTYPTRKARDNEYKTQLKKILYEAKYANGQEIENALFEELYRVSDSLYASREYAKMHGEEYFALRKERQYDMVNSEISRG